MSQGCHVAGRNPAAAGDSAAANTNTEAPGAVSVQSLDQYETPRLCRSSSSQAWGIQCHQPAPDLATASAIALLDSSDRSFTRMTYLLILASATQQRKLLRRARVRGLHEARSIVAHQSSLDGHFLNDEALRPKRIRVLHHEENEAHEKGGQEASGRDHKGDQDPSRRFEPNARDERSEHEAESPPDGGKGAGPAPASACGSEQLFQCNQIWHWEGQAYQRQVRVTKIVSCALAADVQLR